MDWCDLSKWSCENCPKVMCLKCSVLLTGTLILQVRISAGCSQAVKYQPCPEPARGCSQQPPEGSTGDRPSPPLTPLPSSSATCLFRGHVLPLKRSSGMERALCWQSWEDRMETSLRKTWGLLSRTRLSAFHTAQVLTYLSYLKKTTLKPL